MLDKREWLGLLLAPSPLALAVPFYDLHQLGYGLGKDEVLFAFLLFGYPMVIAFGIPIHLLLRRSGRLDFGSYVVAAATIGGLVGLIPLVSNRISPPEPGNPFALQITPAIPLATAILALLSATIFWWVAVRIRRPT